MGRYFQANRFVVLFILTIGLFFLTLVSFRPDSLADKALADQLNDERAVLSLVFSSQSEPLAIPEDPQGETESTLYVEDNEFIDKTAVWVDLKVDLSHPMPDQLEVLLTSSTGREFRFDGSYLATGGEEGPDGEVWFRVPGEFNGPEVGGTWSMEVVDKVSGSEGSLVGWGLKASYLETESNLWPVESWAAPFHGGEPAGGCNCKVATASPAAAAGPALQILLLGLFVLALRRRR